MESIHPVIYEDETGGLALEHCSTIGAVIHCHSYKWNKETYKHYKQVWKIFLAKFGDNPLYAAIQDDDSRLIKFATKFNFEPTEHIVIDTSGKVRRLYKCVR